MTLQRCRRLLITVLTAVTITACSGHNLETVAEHSELSRLDPDTGLAAYLLQLADLPDNWTQISDSGDPGTEISDICAVPLTTNYAATVQHNFEGSELGPYLIHLIDPATNEQWDTIKTALHNCDPWTDNENLAWVAEPATYNPVGDHSIALHLQTPDAPGFHVTAIVSRHNNLTSQLMIATIDGYSEIDAATINQLLATINNRLP